VSQFICQVEFFLLVSIFYNPGMTDNPDSYEQPVEMLDAGEARPWPVRILTGLLFIQALGLIGLSIYSYDPAILQQQDETRAVLTFFTEFPRTLAFGSLGLLALVAGLGFLRLWQTGWPTAMLVQGMGLLVSLGLYLRSNPPYIFGLMSYCILMVIYLHHPDVQQAFQTKKLQESEWPESGVEENL
jgi:hypothetical protein